MFYTILIIIAVIFLTKIVCLSVLQKNGKELIAGIRENEELYESAGSPSKDYFQNLLFYPRYNFLLFILKNKEVVAQYTTKHKEIVFCIQIMIGIDVLLLTSVILSLVFVN